MDSKNNPSIAHIACAVRPILQAHPVLKAYLFGSQARGEQRPGSDVDLYCIIDRSKPFGMFALGALSHAPQGIFAL